MLLHETMLHLFREVLTNFEAETSPQPAWLQTGLRALKCEAVREGGVPAFAQACGRSPEHVSRTTRRLLGKTPGELVNESRMDYAAQRLRMSHAKILDIMMDCGIANSGYFYQLFRQHYGLTPHAYRRQSFKVF